MAKPRKVSLSNADPRFSKSQIDKKALVARGGFIQKFDDFANTSWNYGYNTTKVALGLGLILVGATLFERFTRWAFRTARGTYEYWKNEYKDIKYQGNDPELM